MLLDPSLVAIIAAVISLGSLISTLTFSVRQHKQNDLSRKAYIDLAVQAAEEERTEDGSRYSTTVMMTNAGPAAASQVMVWLKIKGESAMGQGAMRLDPGAIQVFSFPLSTPELERVTLAYVDGRGKRQKRSWTPKSKSWPLRPWALRAIQEREQDT